MKKAFVVGMVVVSTLAANVSFAAGVAKAPREVLMEYTKQSKEALFGKGGSAKTMSEASANQVKQTLIKELNLSSSKAASMKSALSGEAGKARLENLVTIIAAKRLSVESISKTDAAEATSIEKAADASAGLIANSVLIGAVKDSAIPMKAEELSLVRESLGKLETLSGEVLVNFSRAERDSYTQIMTKLETMAESGQVKSYEEAFITSIMEVKKVDRTKALEIVKKLKECV